MCCCLSLTTDSVSYLDAYLDACESDLADHTSSDATGEYVLIEYVDTAEVVWDTAWDVADLHVDLESGWLVDLAAAVSWEYADCAAE